MFRKLKEGFNSLAPSDRSGFLDDLFSLGIQRDSSKVLEQALILAHTIQHAEEEYIVWAPILRHVRW